MTITWCKECGRDLVADKCSWCDRPVRVAKSEMSLEERVYRCIARNPGVSSSELSDYLELGDDDRDALNQRLAALVQRGAVRFEKRPGLHAMYFVVEGGRATRRFGSGRPISADNPTAVASRERRRKRRENGECVDCAQPMANKEWARCESCRERMRGYAEKRRAA